MIFADIGCLKILSLIIAQAVANQLVKEAMLYLGRWQNVLADTENTIHIQSPARNAGACIITLRVN